MTHQRQKIIDPLSARSLYLELTALGQSLGTATGFVVEHGERYYLITNWHVVSGRQPETNSILSPTGAVPNELRIVHHGRTLGNWVVRIEPLLDENGDPLWLEHPRGRQVDVVALLLHAIDEDVRIYPFDLSLADTDMVPQVAMPVSIIGFPFGLASAGAFPIWKTGHIASDPDLDYKSLPAFLIDATTRGGMSGSPVVLRLLGGYSTRSGNIIMAQAGSSTLFLGVYSGRIHGQSEIGIVWRPHVISEILERTA